MSQSFSFSRFGRLFSKHTAEHLRLYLMSTVVLLGGTGLVLGYVAYLTPGPFNTTIQSVVFMVGLFSSGTFFTSTVLAEFGNQRQATAALMMPASHWEKYLVGWLFALPIFLLVYIGCFYLMDSIVISLDDWSGARPGFLSLFSDQEGMPTILLAYAVLSALFLWGSLYSHKQQFIRTAFVLMLGMVVLAVVNLQLVRGLVGEQVDSVRPFLGVLLRDGKDLYQLKLNPTQRKWFGLMPVSLLLLAWAGAYARLKERQV